MEEIKPLTIDSVRSSQALAREIFIKTRKEELIKDINYHISEQIACGSREKFLYYSSDKFDDFQVDCLIVKEFREAGYRARFGRRNQYLIIDWS